MPRVVIPGLPHHVTQRGTRKMRVFFREEDYRLYPALLAEQAARYELECWCYCLMPNHVHLVVVPGKEKSLARAFGEAHRRYARNINEREGWRGHLWQERFYSCPMSETHVYNTFRYVLTNPVRAGLTSQPEEWPYTSHAACVAAGRDPLIGAGSPDWPLRDGCLALAESEDDFDFIRSSTRSGRPLGGEAFVEQLEKMTGRCLRRHPPGPRPKEGRETDR